MIVDSMFHSMRGYLPLYTSSFVKLVSHLFVFYPS